MENCSSNSSKGGNTKTPLKKQISPAKRWCFVLNNYTQEEIDYIVPLCHEEGNKCIISKEVGKKCGTPHLQGFIEFHTKKRPMSVFSETNRINWRLSKKSATDYHQTEYCAKDYKDNLDELLVFFGLPKPRRPLKVINPDRPFQEEILEIVQGEPCDRKIFWYFGEGGIGKTQFCKYLSHIHGAICLSGKGADVRNGVCEYLKTNGDTPELVLFPIPRSYNTEYLSYEALENIKDMYFYSGKYEGGMINGNPPHLIVFANEPPDISKMSKDRWMIFHIDNETFKTDKWSGY